MGRKRICDMHLCKMQNQIGEMRENRCFRMSAGIGEVGDSPFDVRILLAGKNITKEATVQLLLS